MLTLLRSRLTLLPHASAPLSTASRILSSKELSGPLRELPIVAIVGRPNVGKSALFNRLVRKRTALVFDTPDSHVTRDYREGTARLADLTFRVLDTSGLEPFSPSGSIQWRATALTSRALQKSNLTLLLMDAREGVSSADIDLGRWLRQNTDMPVLPVMNKCERKGASQQSGVAEVLADALSLGYGEPVAISAETGEGMSDLYEVLQPHIDELMEKLNPQDVTDVPDHDHVGAGDATPESLDSTAIASKQLSLEEQVALVISGQSMGAELAGADDQENEEEAPPVFEHVHMAIMGLPNVGKSTLTNWLLQDERCITGPEPGLTRDPVRASISHQGHRFDLIDTPGFMRKSRLDRFDEVKGAVAGACQAAGIREMRYAAVVLVLVDAVRVMEEGTPAMPNSWGLSRQELKLVSEVAEEGRALLIGINKMDAVAKEQRGEVLKAIRNSVAQQLPQVGAVPCFPLSALTGNGAQRVLPAVLSVYRRWNKRLTTSTINSWLEEARHKHHGTATGGLLKRVRYITQVDTRPPRFAVFAAGSEEVPPNFTRFMIKSLRDSFGLEGTPVRLLFKYKQKYADRGDVRSRQ